MQQEGFCTLTLFFTHFSLGFRGYGLGVWGLVFRCSLSNDYLWGMQWSNWGLGLMKGR